MYQWYERAAVCYVYLSDVNSNDYKGLLEDSEWFSRGWTLQELIAPANVRFYDRNWQYLGDKKSLSRIISFITGIGEDILEGRKPARQCSIAQRMSWAARRRTTRIEDRAYSLLGLFDINMPMLYGEGEKSFIRLQEEIIKGSDDQSVFAWSGLAYDQPGMLAPSPDAFTDAGEIESIWLRQGTQPYGMNNRGLSMNLYMIPYCTDTYLAVLNCTRKSWKSSEEDREWLIGIFLRRLLEDDQYAQVTVYGEDLITKAYDSASYAKVLSKLTSINVRQRPFYSGDHYYFRDRVYGFRIDDGLLERDANGTELFEVRGINCKWDPIQRTATLNPGTSLCDTVATLDISKQSRRIKMIRFGFDKDFNPTIFLAEGSAVDERRSESLDPLRDKAFASRSSNDEKGWSTLHRMKNGKLTASFAARREGLWSIKCDRITGLDVYLTDTYYGNEREDGHVILRREVLGDYLVWNVYVGGFREAFGNKIRNAMTTLRRGKTSDAKMAQSVSGDFSTEFKNDLPPGYSAGPS